MNLDIQNDEGVTAQFCAVFFGQTEIVQLLYDAGADPNIQEENGLTSLMYACDLGNSNIVYILINYIQCKC